MDTYHCKDTKPVIFAQIVISIATWFRARFSDASPWIMCVLYVDIACHCCWVTTCLMTRQNAVLGCWWMSSILHWEFCYPRCRMRFILYGLLIFLNHALTKCNQDALGNYSQWKILIHIRYIAVCWTTNIGWISLCLYMFYTVIRRMYYCSSEVILPAEEYCKTSQISLVSFYKVCVATLYHTILKNVFFNVSIR